MLPTAVVTALLTLALVGLQMSFARQRAVESLDSYADLLGGVVLDGLREAMLANDRPRLESELSRMAASHYVLRMDVVSKAGTVVFSSNPGAVGEKLSRESPSCTVCHSAGKPPPTTGRTLHYPTDGGRTVFRFVQPIAATQECLRCHQGAALGENLGILLTDLDDTRLMAGQLRGARELSWALVLSFAVLLGALAIVIRFVLVARLRNVARLLEFIRAGSRAEGPTHRSRDEIDEIERLVQSVALDLEDQNALDRTLEGFFGVLERFREPILIVDPKGRTLGANRPSLKRFSGLAAGLPPQLPGVNLDGLWPDARENGWALGDAQGPLIAAIEDREGRAQAFALLWTEVAGEEPEPEQTLRLTRADPEWRLYTAAVVSSLGPEPKRWKGVLQLDRRLTSGRRLLADLSSLAAEVSREATDVNLRSLGLLALWDLGRQLPDVTWHALLDESHRATGARYQARALVQRLTQAAAAQARAGGQAVLFTQSSADGEKVFLGAWARSNEPPLPLEEGARTNLAVLLAQNLGGGIEVDPAFDIGPLAAARKLALPCDSRGVLFVAELSCLPNRKVQR